ncbi:hypothetical protein [Blochmannia endosymbiont of Camponotus modoc]|uniref:hypothetical protein n=1 Tax=Blochmannia endosymbiont of Camponotus modoc TaxID=2945587 RepID=UPI002024DF6C|nr:hypothetical protein [Blochmannia endosymbiont of Camponotus modoc]URJ31774.1 hypothetical protein M9395_00035 [Blochmannia endosymbiont of Camponotus modoc]
MFQFNSTPQLPTRTRPRCTAAFETRMPHQQLLRTWLHIYVYGRWPNILTIIFKKVEKFNEKNRLNYLFVKNNLKIILITVCD